MRTLESLNNSIEKFNMGMINVDAYETKQGTLMEIDADTRIKELHKTQRAIEIDTIDERGRNIRYRFSRGTLYIEEDLRKHLNIKHEYMYSERNFIVIASNYKTYTDKNYSEQGQGLTDEKWEKLKKFLNKAYKMCFNDEISLEEVSKILKEYSKKVSAKNKEITQHNVSILKNIEEHHNKNNKQLDKIVETGDSISRFYITGEPNIYTINKELHNKITSRLNKKRLEFKDYFVGYPIMDAKTNNIMTVAIVDAPDKNESKSSTKKGYMSVQDLRFRISTTIKCRVIVIKHKKIDMNNKYSIDNLEDVSIYEIDKVPARYQHIVIKLLFSITNSSGCDISTYREIYGLKYFDKILRYNKDRYNKHKLEDAINNCKYIEDVARTLEEQFKFKQENKYRHESNRGFK